MKSNDLGRYALIFIVGTISIYLSSYAKPILIINIKIKWIGVKLVCFIAP